MIVNRTFAEEIVGSGNALARRVRYINTEDTGLAAKPGPWYEIVGVVEDFPANNDRPTLYHPLAPAPIHPVTLTLRVGSNAQLAVGRLREVTTALDPTLRVGRLRSLDEIYWQRRSADHMLGFVLGSVMLTVLLFSAAGI